MTKFAFAHPGKLGDALYCLPVMRKLCADHNATCDFYTSSYCAPLKRLFEYQSFISTFHVAQDYVLNGFGCGCQPPYVPVPDGYDAVYQLGYKEWPHGPLHQSIANSVGINEPLCIQYDYPRLPIVTWNGARAITFKNKLGHEPRMHLPYVCVAPRHPSSYNDFFYNLTLELRKRDVNVVQIGNEGEYIGVGRDATGFDMRRTVSLLSRARAFIGLMSSQLVLANGFDIPRIAVHDGVSYTMDHVVNGPWNHYPVWPTVEHVLTLLEDHI